MVEPLGLLTAVEGIRDGKYTDLPASVFAQLDLLGSFETASDTGEAAGSRHALFHVDNCLDWLLFVVVVFLLLFFLLLFGNYNFSERNTILNLLHPTPDHPTGFYRRARRSRVLGSPRMAYLVLGGVVFVAEHVAIERAIELGVSWIGKGVTSSTGGLPQPPGW